MAWVILKKKLKESSPQNKQKAEVLSIVIPVSTAQNSSICLEALEKQTAQKSCFEVTVADDGSTDETLQMLSSLKQL
ncbi:MAG: hypothetical protein Ct9H300mP21_04560 [Pseudomonadota bacterium]|nr:MAG: hypothetical protein Ct9H300mP21_04560 [Pseudomonadota bacterium]